MENKRRVVKGSVTLALGKPKFKNAEFSSPKTLPLTNTSNALCFRLTFDGGKTWFTEKDL